MNISISEEVRARCPEAALGILQYEAQVAPSSSALLELFEHTLRELSECHTLDSIAQIPHIAAHCGKRARPAVPVRAIPETTTATRRWSFIHFNTGMRKSPGMAEASCIRP